MNKNYQFKIFLNYKYTNVTSDNRVGNIFETKKSFMNNELPPVLNQHSMESCYANQLSTMLAGMFMFTTLQQHIKLIMPSRLFIHTVEVNTRNNLSIHEGGDAASIAKVINQCGIPYESEYRYTGNVLKLIKNKYAKIKGISLESIEKLPKPFSDIEKYWNKIYNGNIKNHLDELHQKIVYGPDTNIFLKANITPIYNNFRVIYLFSNINVNTYNIISDRIKKCLHYGFLVGIKIPIF